MAVSCYSPEHAWRPIEEFDAGRTQHILVMATYHDNSTALNCYTLQLPFWLCALTAFFIKHDFLFHLSILLLFLAFLPETHRYLHEQSVSKQLT